LLFSKAEFEKWAIQSNLLIGGYYGFILLTVLVLIVLFFSTKKWLYITYAFFVLSYSFLPFVELGLAKIMFYPNVTIIEFHPLLVGSIVSFVALCLFAFSFFELHKNQIRLGKLLLSAIGTIILLVILWLIFPNFYRSNGVVFQLMYYTFLVLTFVLVWVITIRSIKSKGINGKLFAFGYGFFTVISVLYFLIDAGKLSLIFTKYPPMLYSSLVEIIVLNIIVGYKIWTIQNEKRSLITTVFRLQNELVESIESARLVERKEISKWIHDKVGSRISFMKLALSSKQANFSNTELKDHISKLSLEIRELNAKVDDDISLKKWCENYFEELNSLGFTKFNILEFDDVELEERKSSNLKLIIQELCNNVLKHAHASNAELQIIEHENYLSFSFEDDGTGMVKPLWQTKKNGGFASLKDRLNGINAEYEFSSQSLKGMTLIAEIPRNTP
jgi:signal transduction histidine kinase